MTQSATHGDFSCSVDLSATESNDNAAVVTSETAGAASAVQSSTEEVFTTVIEATEEPSGFAGFGFSDALLKTLQTKGYKDPSPIQAATFPELMLGRDLVGQAQTGTGKTAAFALPLLERLEKNASRPQALVLAPTRELAMQVADSFKAYAAGHPHLNVLAIYGGSDFRSQIHALKRGVDVVVGTPGRVMDHMRQGTLDTSGLRSLGLDEADEMLRMGFIDDVEWILDQLPEERQVVLFSRSYLAPATCILLHISSVSHINSTSRTCSGICGGSRCARCR